MWTRTRFEAALNLHTRSIQACTSSVIIITHHHPYHINHQPASLSLRTVTVTVAVTTTNYGTIGMSHRHPQYGAH